MADRSRTLAALRRQLAVVSTGPSARADEMFALGHGTIDAALGGGLARGRLHEVHAASAEDTASAAGFALILALRACPAGRPIFWLRQEAGARRTGHVHAPGLAELGADPASVVFVLAADETMLLRAAADVVRSAAPPPRSSAMRSSMAWKRARST